MFYTSFDTPGLVKVLNFLKMHNKEYLSGQDLSDVLKISRVAVWKHIKKIKMLGYKIDSKQKLGYRLVGNTNLLLPWEITDGLKTKKIGKRIYFFDSIDSTQSFAQGLSLDPKERGAIVIAAIQTKGRGRIGRRWESPKGGIWLSLIIDPHVKLDEVTIIPLAVSLALSNAIYSTAEIATELKWPNDVTIKGKKVAGIITDMSLQSSTIESIVVGVGINFDIDVKQVENVLSKTPNYYGVESLSRLNKNLSAKILVQKFLEETEEILRNLEKNGPTFIIKNWTKNSSTVGKKVKIITEGEIIEGEALKVNPDGSLAVKTKNGLRSVVSGDVKNLR